MEVETPYASEAYSNQTFPFEKRPCQYGGTSGTFNIEFFPFPMSLSESPKAMRFVLVGKSVFSNTVNEC